MLGKETFLSVLAYSNFRNGTHLKESVAITWVHVIFRKTISIRLLRFNKESKHNAWKTPYLSKSIHLSQVMFSLCLMSCKLRPAISKMPRHY